MLLSSAPTSFLPLSSFPGGSAPVPAAPLLLTTVSVCRSIPGPMGNVVTVPTQWLNLLIAAADATIRQWTKQGLTLRCYTEYLDGNEQTELVLQQFPLWSGTTQVADASNGVALPTATINVVSTLNPDGTQAFDEFHGVFRRDRDDE